MAALGAALADEKGASAVSTTEPSRAILDELTRDEEARRATIEGTLAEIAAVNSGIGELLAAQRTRRRSLWRRWLPDDDTDARIAALRAERGVLNARYARELMPYTRTIADHARAKAAFAQETAEAKGKAAKAKVRLDFEQGVVARARKILAALPAIAYAGADLLMRLARRIEDCRRRGWAESKPDVGTPSVP